MRFRSRICDLFGIEHPVVLAGMGGAAGPDLAAAVSEAGGLGVLGAAACTPEQLDDWITRARKLTDAPFGVDTLLPASVPRSVGGNGGGAGGDERPSIPPEVLEARDEFMAEHGLAVPERRPSGRSRPPRRALVKDFFDAQLEVVLDHGVAVYAAGLGVPPEDFMRKGRQKGMRFMGVAGNTRHARKLADAGVDAVVAQGTDGGGHNTPIGTLALVPQVVDEAAPLPVLAAGGIADGRGIAAAFMLGAQGVWVGTRFLATREADIPEYQKRALLAATERDTVVSRSISGKPARLLRGAWTDVYERGEIEALPMPYQGIVAGPVLKAAIDGERADVYPGIAGQAVGLIGNVSPAAEVVAQLVAEATERLAGVRSLDGVVAEIH